MKQLQSLIIVLLALPTLILASCTIAEQIEVEIVYAPQLHAKFEVAAAPVEIRDARLFIYDADSLLVRDTVLLAEQLNSAEPLVLVKGIAAGQYTMVSYYNVKQMDVRGTEVGVSKIADLEVKLTDERAATTQIDSLCYSFAQFSLQRGDPTITTSEILTAHYFVNLRITGLDRPTVPLGQVGVMMLDVPRSLGARSNVCSRGDMELALTSISAAESQSNCMTLKFLSADKVKLRVLEDGVSIQTILLEPERYFMPQLPTNILNIELQFYANSYVVSVNDWKIGEYELIDFGS